MMKKKKRMLSLLLAVIMTLSMWSVPVFAEEITADMEIKSGETIEVTEVMTVKFVPEKSGTYYFMSESKADPITYLSKGNTSLRTFDDTSLPGMEKENGRDFQASYDFTAGETYYFKLNCYGSFGKYQFTIGSNIIKHQPESAEPFVEAYKAEGVTYQWYEVEKTREITPASADVSTYEGKTSSYDEEIGWIPALTGDIGGWYTNFFKKDFVTGESIKFKLDHNFDEYDQVQLYGILLYDGTKNMAYDEVIYNKADDSFTLTAKGKGTYQLVIEIGMDGEPDVTLRAYSEDIEKVLTGETETTLKNPEVGKKYFCRMKLADGSFMDSKSFVYEYYFSHQPAETEPYVEGNFEDAKGVTYQWYAVSGQEVTPGSAAYVPDDCTYSAVDGWSDGAHYDDDNAYYWYGMFRVELKAGQLLKVETKGTVEDFISLYSYDKSDTVYSLNPTGREDDTYIFTITEEDTYELYFHAGTDDMSVKAYVLDPEKSSEAVEGETESRFKEPAIGNGYFCRVMTDEGILNSEMFYYDYAITHYPTLEEPRVEMNETEGVTTYQWYELDVSGAEKITSECENIVYAAGYYEEGRGWIGDQEPATYNPEHTYYDIFYIYLEEGQTITVLPKGEVGARIALDGLDCYWTSGSGIGNDLYRFEVSESGIYDLCFYGTTEDIAVEAWIGDVTMKSLEGETQNTLSDASNGGLYSCMVKGENGKELQTGYIDRTYRFTVQPVNGAASVQVNYPEDVAEIRWYRGTLGEEITPSAVTSSAVTSSAVNGAALYPYDAEKGWTGKWEQRGEGYMADFLKVALSTRESISIVVDGTIMYGCGLYDYGTHEEYYKELGEETDGVYSFTVKRKGMYVPYTVSQTTDVAIRAYRGEITYSPLKDQNNFRLYNAEDGVYCCEVEYRNGKTIRSKTVFLEDMETLSGVANPVISQSEPGTIRTSWSAAENASAYAVSLYRNGEVAEACTSAALSHTFDITEKGSYFFTVNAEKRKGADVYDATVTSAALNIYGVTFDANDGTEPAEQLVADGAKAAEPSAVPSKNGYTFDGWYKGGTKWNFETAVTADVVLTAKFTDTQAPTGTLKIGSSTWSSLATKADADLFFKENRQVEITAADTSNEEVSVKYLVSDTLLTAESLKDKTFTEYTEPFTVSAEGTHFVYAKLTDKNGNVTYISSDAFIIDKTKPVVGGIEDGESYTEAQTVTVTDDYILKVTVNGEEVSVTDGQFVVNPADGAQTIVVTDKAGNETSVTITVSAGILGDVDGSGDIKAEDALMVLKSVAHMVTLTTEEEKLADVDKSGDVKAEDALLILKYVAHMVSGF